MYYGYRRIPPPTKPPYWIGPAALALILAAIASACGLI